MWALRGLRDGVVTTRWPARPDPYAAAVRGPATVVAPADADDRLDRLCPTGAISRPGATVRLDQGKCVQCGRCVAARPDAFGWTDGPAAAALSRGGLVVPEFAETPDRLAALRNGLKTKTPALRRSVPPRPAGPWTRAPGPRTSCWSAGGGLGGGPSHCGRPMTRCQIRRS